MYEVFTREHVAGLAAYFRARAAKRLGAEASTRSLRVLELGAGSGVLSRALAAATRAMDAAGRVNGERTAACSVTYHATDDYSFRERTKASREPNDETTTTTRTTRTTTKPFAPRITASRSATRRCATGLLRMWC